MSVKILGGKAKSLSLDTPKSNAIRPTSVMLKRKLFDSMQDFSNYVFVDLCAGSGSIGFEALSRGAHKCFFIDSNIKAINAIKENKKRIHKFGIESSQIEIVKQDGLKWLRSLNTTSLQQNNELFIFFDPPYDQINLYEGIFEYYLEQKTQLILLMEACQQKTLRLEEFLKKFPGHKKVFKQGTSFFVLYERL